MYRIVIDANQESQLLNDDILLTTINERNILMKQKCGLFIIILGFSLFTGIAKAGEAALFTSHSMTPETALVAASECRVE
jgi:hypothetical protein